MYYFVHVAKFNQVLSVESHSQDESHAPVTPEGTSAYSSIWRREVEWGPVLGKRKKSGNEKQRRSVKKEQGAEAEHC